jgi:hypothetical protein
MIPQQLPLPPRRIRRRREASSSWLLWSVVVGGMVLAFTPLLLLIARHLVLSSGQVVDATIDEIYIVRSKNTDYPHARFHYTLAGRTRQGDQEIDQAERTDLRPGKLVQTRVKVFFGWPDCFLIVPSVDAHPALGIMVAIGTPLGSWVLAWIVYGQDFRDRRLVRTGLVAAGTITGHRSSPGRGTNRYVDFEFHTPDGFEHHGQMQPDGWAYAMAKIGDAVTVLYDPARPHVSTVYELCTYEVVPPVDR